MTAEQWRDLLGHDVVMLGWPLGSKGTKRKWGHLTAANMTPQYLQKLEGRNIGVALGEVSGGLIAVDVDLDPLIPEFLALNPAWQNTLQTHGARGRVFWLRMNGGYPGRTAMLRTHAGDDAGEFRSNGSQSIIHGIHPDTQAPYQIVIRAKPLIVDFASIKWPAQITNPPTVKSELPVTGTEEPEDTEDTKDTDESEEVPAWLFSVHSDEDALRAATPSSVHQNYRCALILARAVKAIEAQIGKPFTPAEHCDIHKQWLKRAARFLRPGQTNEDYFMEYLNAYQLAKFPLGSVAVGRAITAAKKTPLPPAALPWTDDPDVRLLAAICRELQINAGKDPFYLSGRTVQAIFKHETHAIGAKWLRSLCAMQIINEIEKGKGLRATRYRYKGTLA